MTFSLSDEERGIVLRALKARLEALHGEMTQTDSPAFNIQLKHEKETIQALIERLDFAVLGPRGVRSDDVIGQTDGNG